MNENTEKRGPGRPPNKVEVQGNTVTEKVEAAPDKAVERIIAVTGDERSVASTLDLATEKKWTDKKIKQVVESVDPMSFTEPQKMVLDRIKNLHPDYTAKYRYINDNNERVSRAIHTEHWKPVNRTSHPNTPNDLINDRFGCVECMGQLLMFRPEKVDSAFVMKPRIVHREKLKELNEKAEFDDRFYQPKTSGEVTGKAFYQDEDSEEKDFVHDFVEE